MLKNVKKLLAALLVSAALISTVPVYASETNTDQMGIEGLTVTPEQGGDIDDERSDELEAMLDSDIQTLDMYDHPYMEREPNEDTSKANALEDDMTMQGTAKLNNIDVFGFHTEVASYVDVYMITDSSSCEAGLHNESGALIQQFTNAGKNKDGYHVNRLQVKLNANSSLNNYWYISVQELGYNNASYAFHIMISPFLDVYGDDFFYDPVIWAVKNNITTGAKEGYFEPNNTCTRGQVVTFLWRAAGSPTPKTTKNPFKDIKSSDYYYNAVLWAVEKGITNGISNNQFGPNQGCTRGQVVTFLHRAALTPSPSSGGKSFKDVSSGEFYYNPVRWAVQQGITQGISNTEFGPNDTCTRGQIVTFLYRGNNVINWDALNKHSATTEKISTTRLTKSSNGKYSAYVLNASGDTITKITIEEKYYFDLLGYTQAQINQLPSISQANKNKYSAIKGFTYTDTLTSSYYELKLSIDATNKDALLKANELGLISLSGGATNLSLSQSVENIKKSGYVVSYTS